jgi:DNA-binding transcriptional ArsR family regulator
MHSDQSISVLKALADKTRLDIIRRLAREDAAASCGDVSTCSSLSQPAMSHHFNKLAEAGVILEHRNGKQKFYELNKEFLQGIGIDPSRL